MKKLTVPAEETIEFFSMLIGIIAVSPWKCSQTKKIPKAQIDPQKRPMIIAEFQGWFTPPHSRANRSIIMAGAKMKNPSRSSLRSCPRRETLVLLLMLASGIRTKNRTMAITPPMGTLM
jgi:hypothetical protein